MKQMTFFKPEKLFFGGALGAGRRKSARPLSVKRPLHLVLKCKKSISLRKNQRLIKSLTSRYSQRFGIRIYNQSVQKDHYHVVLRIYHRQNYKNFIRALTSGMARQIGAQLWQSLPFTRILSWGPDFQIVLKYVLQNEEEALGVRAYKPRKNYYSRYRLEPI